MNHFDEKQKENLEIAYTESVPQKREQIVKAIEEHDESLARRLLNHHIDSVNQYSKVVLEKHPEYFLNKWYNHLKQFQNKQYRRFYHEEKRDS